MNRNTKIIIISIVVIIIIIGIAFYLSQKKKKLDLISKICVNAVAQPNSDVNVEILKGKLEKLTVKKLEVVNKIFLKPENLWSAEEKAEIETLFSL